MTWNITSNKYTTKDLEAILNGVHKYSVGLEDVVNRVHAFGSNTMTSYPPYNIVKESGSKWYIEMALAGWKKEEIQVTTEFNVLVISSKGKGSEESESDEYVHRGLAKRTFTRSFNLASDVEVGNITYADGLLKVELMRVIPDQQKRRYYGIV
jgi:molecular chaperone IbpA